MSEARSTNAIDRAVGMRMRARRLELGISQERLADTVGVTFQQVQKYEKGVNRIAASRLFEISRALDLEVSRFFDGLSPELGAAHRVAIEEQTRVLATEDGSEMLRLFGLIDSPKIRRRVVDLVRTLAGDGEGQ